jgi:YihY family inner membrane protein
MSPIERIIRHADAWQLHHRVPAFGFAVFKKFGDDQAGNQVALLTYFAFLATFPLLLALVGILGIVLKNDHSLQQRIVNSSFGQFPIIGSQIHSQLGTNALPHSGIALIIGLLGAILGGRGLANAVQNALNTLWNVPKVDRPGFPSSYLRTFGLLGLLGLGAVLTAVASTIAGAGKLLGLSGVPIQILGLLISAIIDAGLFLAAFRLATAKTVPIRDLRLSAVLSAIAWQILLAFAGLIIKHYLSHATAVAGTFGIVLGLLAWFGLQATITIYLIEVDVVRARRLWPRSITQRPLTDADKQFLHAATDAETRHPEQHVDVSFTADADRDQLRDPGD